MYGSILSQCNSEYLQTAMAVIYVTYYIYVKISQ